ncbi:hypothetical protein ACYUJ6_14585 [Clostridium sp. JNZ X4-2]
MIGNMIIYNGKYGLGMTSQPDSNWGIGIFDTFPLQEISNMGEFVIGDENDFFDDKLFEKFEKETQDRIASIGLNFQIN